jgi:hypothetical protein
MPKYIRKFGKFLKVINFSQSKYEDSITWLIISANFSIRTYCKKFISHEIFKSLLRLVQ